MSRKISDAPWTDGLRPRVSFVFVDGWQLDVPLSSMVNYRRSLILRIIVKKWLNYSVENFSAASLDALPSFQTIVRFEGLCLDFREKLPLLSPLLFLFSFFFSFPRLLKYPLECSQLWKREKFNYASLEENTNL